MTTLLSNSIRMAGCIAIATGAIFAQQAPKGAYVLAQTGSVSATLSSLSFAGDGWFTGTEIIQVGGPIATYSLQGTYVVNADSSKTLIVSGTSIDAVDANGDPLVLSETLKLIPVAGDSFITLRTDPGQYVRGSLSPAAVAITPGDYVISGKMADPASTSIELVSLDAAGNVTGREVVNSFGSILERPLTGAYAATSTGFQKITVSFAFTDGDGNSQTSTETYLALPTNKDVKMMRIDDGGVGILTLSK